MRWSSHNVLRKNCHNSSSHNVEKDSLYNGKFRCLFYFFHIPDPIKASQAPLPDFISFSVLSSFDRDDKHYSHFHQLGLHFHFIKEVIENISNFSLLAFIFNKVYLASEWSEWNKANEFFLVWNASYEETCRNLADTLRKHRIDFLLSTRHFKLMKLKLMNNFKIIYGAHSL